MESKSLALPAAANRWVPLLPVLVATVVVAAFLAGLAALLELPQLVPTSIRAARAFLTGVDAERVGRIEGVWRAKGGPTLVAIFLLTDTLLFIPLYVATLRATRAVLLRGDPRDIGRFALARIWWLCLGALVVADLAENGLIAWTVFSAEIPSEPVRGLLRIAGTAKWLFAAAILLATAVGAIRQRAPIRWGARMFRCLEATRDLATYLWTYFVPLGMVALGLGILAAVPQTREVLQGMRRHTPQGDGGMLLAFFGLVAWLTCCTLAFRLLDGLGTTVSGARLPPPTRLRARHQLLLGVASLLSTTQLLVVFVPAATAMTAVLLASGSVTLWISVMFAWEAGLRVSRLPHNEAARIVRTSTLSWVYFGMLAAVAAWCWLPAPDDRVIGGLGFFRPPDKIWRFNPALIKPDALLPPLLAILGTALVLWGFASDPAPTRAVSRARRGAVMVGLALWLTVSVTALGPEIVLYQFLLLVFLASSVWLLTRLARTAAYEAWWAEVDAHLRHRIALSAPAIPEWLLSRGSRFLKDQLVRQLMAPIYIFGMLTLVVLIAGNVTGPTLAVQMGTLTIVFLGLASWGLLITWLFVYWPKRHGLGNWMLAPLLWAFIAAPSAPLSPERAARADPLATQALRLPTLHEHVRLWRGGLPDAVESPIFVVAAAGGGLRATYWTALLLAEMDDRTCGQFGRHVMALSGVSGGSVGVALYAAQRRIWEKRTLPQRCEAGRVAQLRTVLRNDYLSPVLASLVFGDLPQSLVPVRYRTTDRNDALSEAFIEIWAQSFPGPDNLLSMPLTRALPAMRLLPGSSSEGEGVPAQPMVFLNSTGVETGRRVIASNVSLSGLPADPLLSDTGAQSGERLLTSDTSLIDAALNSARFPGLSPAGTVWACSHRFDAHASAWCDEGSAPIGRGSWVHVVDGGFFENSGIETVEDVLAELRGRGSLSIHGNLPPVFLIAISNDQGTRRLCSSRDDPTPRMKVLGLDAPATDQLKAVNGLSYRQRADERTFSSYGGPLTATDALLSVRDGRARLELRRAVGEFGCPFVLEWSLGDFLMDGEAEPALGWMLSSTSFDLMDRAVREYGDSFPFDPSACPRRQKAPRGFIGGPFDAATRCEPEPPVSNRKPLTAGS